MRAAIVTGIIAEKLEIVNGPKKGHYTWESDDEPEIVQDSLNTVLIRIERAGGHVLKILSNEALAGVDISITYTILYEGCEPEEIVDGIEPERSAR